LNEALPIQEGTTMNPRRFLSHSSLAAIVLVAGATPLIAQTVKRPPAQPQTAQTGPRPEDVIIAAIRSHPLTAPYPIQAMARDGKVVLTGLVGTKQVHDMAVRLAIATGLPFRDDLVIDTAAAQLIAQMGGGGVIGSPAASPGTQGVLATTPYIYPPPLLARLDDPFFGFVPPIISYPPWWKRNQRGPMVQPNYAPTGAPQAAALAPIGDAIGGAPPRETDEVKGTVELTVDIAGHVLLRGSVASEETARQIIEAARTVPGVASVTSELTVVPRRAPAESPPPPPLPVPGPPTPENRVPKTDSAPPTVLPLHPRAAPAAAAPTALDFQALSRRVVAALERRPQAAELPVKVRSSDGVVTLSGQVPSAYEAMLVYRAAEQTPGAREIVDRLEFTVPDENHPNPLLQKGRPEDIEPYLTSQIRRHVGDLAHIDSVRAHGNLIELKGTLQHPGDHDRLMATLRSIPVLHGFRLEPEFKAE
jgi:osmotically-inducible protein OsmY